MSKILNVYYNDSKQTVSYYPNDDINNLMKTIFKTFGLLKIYDFDTLNDDYIFLNEDGIPLSFNGYGPDELSLYLKFMDLDMEKNKKNSEPWLWDAKWNEQHCGYGISADGKKIYYNGSEKKGSSMPILIGTKKLTSGLHKWRVVWKEEKSYHVVSIVDDISKSDAMEKWGTGFNQVPFFYKYGKHTLGKRIVDIELDMDNRTIKINDEEFTDLPSAVYPAICFKMPHYMEATLYHQK